MTDLLVPNAARGKPPPIDLARQIMSGWTPKYSLAPPLQETRLWNTETDVHENRFEDDRGNFAGIFLEPTLDGGEIVKGGNEHIRDGRLRHTEAAGDRGWSVDVAVIGSMWLDAN